MRQCEAPDRDFFLKERRETVSCINLANQMKCHIYKIKLIATSLLRARRWAVLYIDSANQQVSDETSGEGGRGKLYFLSILIYQGLISNFSHDQCVESILSLIIFRYDC